MSRMTNAPDIPVLILSGGLGSGKTTLLNHLLLERVERLGVIINDFGAINVDAFLVNSHVDATAAISGSCLCCIEDTSELDDALTMLAAADLDAIVVEASGLAEPGPLAGLIAGSPVRGVTFGGIVQLIDAAAWHADGTLPGRENLRVASLLGITKTDRLPAASAAELCELIAASAPNTPVVEITEGRLDASLLFDAAADQRAQPTLAAAYAESLGHGHDHEHEHEHEHERWSQVTVESGRGVDPERLISLLEAPPPGVYRIKGAVRVGDARARWVVQGVGGWFRFTRDRWPSSDPRTTRLVAIGVGIDTEAVEADLHATLTDATEITPDAAALLERHSQRPTARPEQPSFEFETIGPTWWPDPEDD